MPEVREIEATLNPLHSRLQHQFDTLSQQRHADMLGMWVFIASEIMFFGAVITAYVMYRSSYPNEFAIASRHLDIVSGTVMTLVLVLSSLTSVLAVSAARKANRRELAYWVIVTILLGVLFEMIKGNDYYKLIQAQEFPGPGFTWSGPNAGVAQLFLYFFFFLTGLHALHLLIGISVMVGVLIATAMNRIKTNVVEMSSLYWHFIDIVWTFLYPLLYLVYRHK